MYFKYAALLKKKQKQKKHWTKDRTLRDPTQQYGCCPTHYHLGKIQNSPKGAK